MSQGRFSGTSRKVKNSAAAAATNSGTSATTDENGTQQQQQTVRVIRLRFGGKRWEVPVFYTAYKIWHEEEGDEDDKHNHNDDAASSSSNSSSSDDDNDNTKKKSSNNNNNKNNTKTKQKDSSGPSSSSSSSSVKVKVIAKNHLLKILISDRIFSNAYKRETARDVEIKKTFPGLSFDEVASFVLRRGELVEIQQDRTQEQKHVATAVQDAINHAYVMIFNKFTGELFEREGEYNLAVKPFIPVVRNLLASSPSLLSLSSSSTTTATPIRFEPIWRVSSWLARQLVLDDSLSSLADEAQIVPPAEIPLMFEVIKKNGEIDDQQKIAIAKLKAIIETDWSGMVELCLPVAHDDDDAEAASLLYFIEDEDEKETNEEVTAEQESSSKNADDGDDDDSNPKITKEKKAFFRTTCLVFTHHLNIPDRSNLQLNWFQSIAQSIFDQTSWKLMCEEAKRIDSLKQPELASSFLREVFDLPSTLSLPHYTSANEVVVATTTIATAAVQPAKQQQQQQQQKTNENKSSEKSNKKHHEDSSDDDEKRQQQNNNKTKNENDPVAAQQHDKYEAMTHKDLQALCKKKGFSTGGKKADLLSRIRSCGDDE